MRKAVIGLLAAMVCGLAIAQSFETLDTPQHQGKTGLKSLVADLDTNFGLLAGIDDKVISLTVTGADLESAGTGTLTIQLKDAAGNDLDEQHLVRTWIGTADDFGVDALTDFSVSTGTQKEEVTANGEYLAISDTNGVVVMAIDNGGAATNYAWASIGGKIVASGAIVCTAP